MAEIRKVGICTGGGDCPGLNAVIRAAVKCAVLKYGYEVIGIEGIGDGFVPRNRDVSLLTGIITTTTEESVSLARRLAREEGIFSGISSGRNVAAALRLIADSSVGA